MERSFWSGRRVLLTGHTGFKGSWLMFWLQAMGARVTGLSLPPLNNPNLWNALDLSADYFVDIRDREAVRISIEEFAPEFVFHLAAQPLVLESVEFPVETFATNVMGTAHILSALKGSQCPVLVVTSDKVYRNNAGPVAFQETSPLGGDDPYSASKAACEHLVASWKHSVARDMRLATARGGNVIGGGDFTPTRLVPDLVTAWMNGTTAFLRFPSATRPWQHVLDVLDGYIRLGERIAKSGDYPEAMNFGPPPEMTCSALEMAQQLEHFLPGLDWKAAPDAKPVDKPSLQLNASLAAKDLDWRLRLPLSQTIQWTAEWYKGFHEGKSARDLCLRQIENYQAI